MNLMPESCGMPLLIQFSIIYSSAGDKVARAFISAYQVVQAAKWKGKVALGKLPRTESSTSLVCHSCGDDM